MAGIAWGWDYPTGTEQIELQIEDFKASRRESSSLIEPLR
jgi:hypothetical protein